jgi:cytochrome c oxidase subunit 2
MGPMDQARDERRAGKWMALLVLFILLASVISFIVAAYIWWLPPLASDRGALDQIFNAILYVTAVAFVAVHVFIIIALWRYGARGKERAAHWHEHLGAELIWTIVPAIGLVALGLVAEVVWAHVYSAPPAGAQHVEVVGRQFQWYIRYPTTDGRFARTDPKLIAAGNPLGVDPRDPLTKENVIAVNDLHLVVNRPVAVRISSVDVVHSFFLPNFRVKQDAVPGRDVQIWFTPTKEGTYQIACAQLCGVGHYTMRGNVTVETQAAFDAWLKQQVQH